MLIRSQDKESIINLNNASSIDIIGFRKENDKYCQDYKNANIWKVTYMATEMLYMGEYSTKEKAIKVLDMICNSYEYFRGGNVYEWSIFKMPQESEVL